MTHSTHPDGFKPAEILNKAADVIETRGWHKGDFMPAVTMEYRSDIDSCPVCVLAAINVAAGHVPDNPYEVGEDDERTEAARALAEHLGLTLRDGDVTEVGDKWNDKVAESAEQVVTALREAAKSAGGTS